MMATIELEKPPSTMSLYYRAVTSKKPGKMQGDTLPTIKAHLRDVTADLGKLAEYRNVCGFPVSGSLPVTYPHILAFPLHMEILVNPLFPFPLLGLVHVRNEITQYRPIEAAEKLQLEVSVGGHTEVAKGVEFGLVTRVRDRAGDLVWESTGTMLSRQKSSVSGGSSKPRKTQDEGLPFEPAEHSEWDVPADIGRRYAGAAGDYNPIHLHSLSAKLFGFPRAIATGMWTKARAAAELEPQLEQAAYTLSLGFKKPVFLPSKARFAYSLTDSGADFALTNQKGDILHLLGDVRYI